MEISHKQELTSTDWKKIGKGFLIVVAGAVLTYVTDLLPTIDLGQYQALVMGLWSIVVNIAQKYLVQTKYIET